MKYRQMGRTGLMVSEICLGTMTFGSQLDESGSIEVVHRALDSGINFIDEADLYAEGLSEQIVGKALKGKRSGVILATKIGAWKVSTDVNKVGLSRKNIMDGIEDSLRRLQTDYIDLYYAHKPDPIVPIEETLRAFDDLVHQGKVRYIACSNYPLWRLSKALCVSEVHGLTRFDCIQPPYNLIGRDIEDEVLPLCESEGIGVCVYNPLAAGLLTGKHDPKKAPAENTRFSHAALGKVYRERYWLDSNFEAISRLKAVAAAHDRSMPQFALAGILNNPAITSVICGVTSLKQLEENTGAVKVELTEEERKACDAVWEQLRPPRFSYGSQQVVVSQPFRAESVSMTASSARLVTLAFAAGTLFAGATGVAIRFSNRELAPIWGASLRVAPAAVLLVFVMLALKLALPRGRALVGAMLFGLVQFAGGFGFFYIALVQIPAGLGQTILALVPLATLLLAVAQHQERLHSAAVVGSLLGLAGVGLISLDPWRESIPLLALLAALASVFCFSQALVIVRRLPSIHPVALNTVGMVSGAFVLLSASILLGEPKVIPQRIETWAAVAYVGVFGTVVVFLLHVYVAQNWGASRAAYALVVIPLVTITLSAWLEQEPITGGLLVGGVLILGGVYLGALRKKRISPSPVEDPLESSNLQ